MVSHISPRTVLCALGFSSTLFLAVKDSGAPGDKWMHMLLTLEAKFAPRMVLYGRESIMWNTVRKLYGCVEILRGTCPTVLDVDPSDPTKVVLQGMIFIIGISMRWKVERSNSFVPPPGSMSTRLPSKFTTCRVNIRASERGEFETFTVVGEDHVDGM